MIDCWYFAYPQVIKVNRTHELSVDAENTKTSINIQSGKWVIPWGRGGILYCEVFFNSFCIEEATQNKKNISIQANITEYEVWKRFPDNQRTKWSKLCSLFFLVVTEFIHRDLCLFHQQSTHNQQRQASKVSYEEPTTSERKNGTELAS